MAGLRPDRNGSSVFAFDGASGQYLWDTGAVAQGGVLAAPMVVNGQLFVADFSGNLSAFGLPPPTPRDPQPVKPPERAGSLIS